MPAPIVFSHANGFPAGTYGVLFETFRRAGFAVHAIERIGHDPQHPVTNNWPHLVQQLHDFAGQVELIWRHLETVLAQAEMTVDDLVSLRFFLASAAHDPENVEILRRHLGDHASARTVICQELLEPAWLVEVEAIAAQE